MKVNGQIVNLDSEVTLLDFLQQSKYDILKIAVELNADIVPKAKYVDFILHDNDAIEVVNFVGGG